MEGSQGRGIRFDPMRRARAGTLKFARDGPGKEAMNYFVILLVVVVITALWLLRRDLLMESIKAMKWQARACPEGYHPSWVKQEYASHAMQQPDIWQADTTASR